MENHSSRIAGTQLENSHTELAPKSLYCVHNKGMGKEHTEYYYFSWGKAILHENFPVDIITKFVENEGKRWGNRAVKGAHATPNGADEKRVSHASCLH